MLHSIDSNLLSRQQSLFPVAGAYLLYWENIFAKTLQRGRQQQGIRVRSSHGRQPRDYSPEEVGLVTDGLRNALQIPDTRPATQRHTPTHRGNLEIAGLTTELLQGCIAEKLSRT